MDKDADIAMITASLADSTAYGAIIEKYEPLLGRYLYRLGLVASEDRDDVLQEIFLKIYVNLNDYDTSLSFSSWAYRIAHNECISFFRKKNVRPQTTDIDLYQETPITDQSDLYALYDQSLTREKLLGAVQKLPENYREVIVLKYFEDKNYDEISDILKKPPNTVATLLRRAKEKLRTLL